MNPDDFFLRRAIELAREVRSNGKPLIQDQAFDYLDAPIKRVCSIDAPAIYSPHIEHEQLPNPRRIVDKVLTLA
mgnify:CR=1 FL=1